VSFSFSPVAAGAAAAAAGAAAAGAGAGAGGAFEGLRMIIVFSKSAAPAAGAGWSLKYLSLCLPISITSLCCRKCFLMGLPFTIVPLVLPRSSTNESFRMVMMAACSPLTARLSI
jgi:hypothetical protein